MDFASDLLWGRGNLSERLKKYGGGQVGSLYIREYPFVGHFACDVKIYTVFGFQDVDFNLLSCGVVSC